MSLQAAILDLDRSVRLTIGREATIRDGSQSPIDAIIRDISLSGCMFSCEADFAVNQIVSLGIPGIGAHRAQISRIDRPQYGCAFLNPITSSDIEVTFTAETLVLAQFPSHSRASLIASAKAGPDVKKLPLSLRVALILGSSLALWVPILLAAKSVFA